MNIKLFQQQVKELSQQLGTATPERRVMYLVSELGEVVDEVIDLTHLDANLSSEARDEVKARLGLELYDLIWNAVDLANLLILIWKRRLKKKSPLMPSVSGNTAPMIVKMNPSKGVLSDVLTAFRKSLLNQFCGYFRHRLKCYSYDLATGSALKAL